MRQGIIKKRVKRSSALVAVLGIGLVAIAGCNAGDKKPKKIKPAASTTSAQTVGFALVTSQAVPRQINATGTISPWEEVVVGAETGGLSAISVTAEEGDTVVAGQPLVNLNDTLLKAQLRQQDAAVASARASLTEAETALRRSRELQSKGYLAQSSLDTSLAKQQTAAAQLASAEAARGETAARLAQTVIRAPVGGLISRRNVTKGQIVSTGAEVFRIVRDSRLELDAEIPETDLMLVKPGMPATITSEQVGQAAGRVRIVTSEVNTTTRLGVARVALSAMGGFRPGMFARATIDAGERPELTVPAAAVLYRENRPGVFVIDATNHVHFRRITVIASTVSSVAASGLNAGERVVVEGAGFLGEGDPVRLGAAAPTATR